MSEVKRGTRRYFYARVSTKKQNLDRQLEAAKKYHSEYDGVFHDKQSGKDLNRDDYQRMKEILEPGDEVVVLSLDRLSRNKKDMKSELAWFAKNGIVVRVLNIPTTLIDFGEGQEWIRDMVNNILVEVMGAIAEQEREMMLERQEEGIAAMPVDETGRKISKKTGRGFGRQEKCPENFAEVYVRQQNGEIKLAEALKLVGVGRTRWYELAREATVG